MSEKMWGSEPYWGLGYEWDPDWVYTDRQKELRATLIELCEKEMRANAKRSDDELLFPRRNASRNTWASMRSRSARSSRRPSSTRRGSRRGRRTPPAP